MCIFAGFGDGVRDVGFRGGLAYSTREDGRRGGGEQTGFQLVARREDRALPTVSCELSHFSKFPVFDTIYENS